MKKNRSSNQCESLKDHENRDYYDDSVLPMWPVGSEVRPTTSWLEFLNYWNRNGAILNIRKQGSDSCDDCLIICK